jgi:probable HAF family extracellular repeat protein
MNGVSRSFSKTGGVSTLPEYSSGKIRGQNHLLRFCGNKNTYSTDSREARTVGNPMLPSSSIPTATFLERIVSGGGACQWGVVLTDTVIDFSKKPNQPPKGPRGSHELQNLELPDCDFTCRVVYEFGCGNRTNSALPSECSPRTRGTQTTAYGINNLGWVAGGGSFPGDLSEHAILWHGGTLTDLELELGPPEIAERLDGVKL